MRRLSINHVTEYRFAQVVTLLPHRMLLRPRENHNVRIEASILDIAPTHSVQWKRDVLDNSMAVASFPEPADFLRIFSGVVIQHYDDDPLDFRVDDYAVDLPFAYAIEDQLELAPFQEMIYPSDRDAIQDWMGSLGLVRPMETFLLLDQLTKEISDRFSYEIREEPGVQPPALTLTRNCGSCRDFAALLIEACRRLGLASRFVSGYLQTFDASSGNGATHAWTEVYLPGVGWKGFDPTIGEVTSNRHIAVAVARHPEAVPPVAGSFIGPIGQTPSLHVAVRVDALGTS